jgi:hypothetical protein
MQVTSTSSFFLQKENTGGTAPILRDRSQSICLDTRVWSTRR